MPENPKALLLLRLAALFAFLDEPVSRRSLLQLTQSDASELDKSLEELLIRKCVRKFDANHWLRYVPERIKDFLTGMGSAEPCNTYSSDPLLMVLLPDSGLSDLERSQRVLDILREHTRRDESAAVLVCINVLLVLAAVITPTGDPFTLSLVFIPLYLLYELSIALVAHRTPDDEADATDE